MTPTEDIKKLIKNIKIKTNPDVDQAVLSDLLNRLDKTKGLRLTPRHPNFWRIIMNKQITKVATAAAVILIVVLGITFLDKTVTPAYAIEQTIEACHKIRYFHFQYFGAKSDQVLKEAWVEYDDLNQIKNVRVNFYKWGGQDMVMVWKDGETQCWFRDKNVIQYFEDELYTKKVFKFVKRYDPIGAVSHLQEQQINGKVKVEINDSLDESDLMHVTATYLPDAYLVDGKTPSMREIFYIDKDTKLILSVEIYALEDDEYKDAGVWEYIDYNQPVEAGMFSLEDELPDDIEHIDLMNQDIGIEQGNLTDEEVAFKVANEFLEALINKDYAKVGKLFGGVSAEKAKERFTVNIVRIVSVGEPLEHIKPPSLRVPCTLEILEDGELKEWQPKGIFIQRVMGRSDRWWIVGGF